MKKIIFDFNYIATIEDFYIVAIKELNLPDYFGNNLDALWDSITAFIDLPIEIIFINLNIIKVKKFRKIINLFEQAEIDLNFDLRFRYETKEKNFTSE